MLKTKIGSIFADNISTKRAEYDGVRKKKKIYTICND